MVEDIVLEASGLHRNFDGTEGIIRVLSGLDLTVRRGEVLSIVGASGVGKSTLLQILGSLDRPDQGTVKIHGRVLDSLKGRELNELRNRVIGFVFQFHFLLPEFTAIENVVMPRLIGGGPWKLSWEQGTEWLGRVGLSDRMHHRPSELSGGEQQRVAVARALINDAEVVLADEPTGNLDETSSEDLHRLLRELSNEHGKTFVVVTHKREFARFADRVLELKNGVLYDVES